jgi:hypothetical protein
MSHDSEQDRIIQELLTGAPSWITPEAVRDTISTFKPHYPNPLTLTEAVEILIRMGNLFELLDAEKCDPKAHERPANH